MFSLAIKNIIFYKGRSLTTFILTFFTTFLFIVYVAFLDGSHDSMLKNSLSVYTGAVQVMKKEYKDNSGYDYLLEDIEQIKEKLSKNQNIKEYSERLEGFALLSGKSDTVGSMVVGINPEKETNISKIKQSLKSGRYLNSDDTNCIYIGAELAKRLKVKVGDEVSLIGNAIDYSFVAENLKVIGTFKTGLFEFDTSSSFVNKSYYDSIMMSENIASYIVIWPNQLSNAEVLAKELDRNNNLDYQAYSWKELMESMVQAMEVDSVFGYISISFLFVINFFVIMIFTFINITSRTKEIGVLRSIGLTPAKVHQLLFLEIVILTAISILFAALIGGYLSYYFEVNPIVIQGIAESYKDYGIISDEIPTMFSLFTLSWNCGLIFVLNILAVLYPIYHINKLSAVEAMRYV